MFDEPRDRILPGFEDVLARFEAQRLDVLSDVVYGLDADLRLAYLNQGWMGAARAVPGWDAAAWPVGRPVLDAIRGPIRTFYERWLRDASVHQRGWEQRYLCPSPGLVRSFWMRVIPVGQGRLLAVHAFDQEIPTPSASPSVVSRYRDDRGLVVQCAHCRRLRAGDDPGRWDWVPAFVEQPPPGTSHGICPPCLGEYYAAPTLLP